MSNDSDSVRSNGPNRLFVILAIGLGGLLILGLIGLGGFLLLQNQSATQARATAFPPTVAIPTTNPGVAPTLANPPAASITPALGNQLSTPAQGTSPTAPASSTPASTSAPAPATLPPPPAPTGAPTSTPIVFGLDRHGCPNQEDRFMDQAEFTVDKPSGTYSFPTGTNVGFTWGEDVVINGQHFGRSIVFLTQPGPLVLSGKIYRIRWHSMGKSTFVEYQEWGTCFVFKDEGTTYERTRYVPTR